MQCLHGLLGTEGTSTKDSYCQSEVIGIDINATSDWTGAYNELKWI